jgi:hypothetical protein
MSSVINASISSNGIVSTADASGILNIQSNGVNTNAQAWVRFNGVTTVTINASYNISSVVRNGTGDYTINFTNALTDGNYSFASMGNNSAAAFTIINDASAAPTSSALRIQTKSGANIVADSPYVGVLIFR